MDIAPGDAVAGVAGDDHPGAAKRQGESRPGQFAVERVPGFGLFQLFEGLPVYPGVQALVAGEGLDVVRLALPLRFSGRPVVVPSDAEVRFHVHARFGEGVEIIVGIFNRQPLRVDLVDGYMHVDVIRVPVNHRHPLVLGEPQLGAQRGLDFFQYLRLRLLAKPERNQQMVGLVRLRPGVERLFRQHFPGRHHRRHAHAVGDEDLSYAVLLALVGCDVLDEMHDAACFLLVQTESSRDHSVP